jgi:hypothetical protein
LTTISKKYQKENVKLFGSNSNLDSLSSTDPLLLQPNEKLDFSEFFMSHNDICGMTFIEECIYIAAKYEITVISIEHQKVKAQYGIEGNGPKQFKHILYVYIPSDHEKNLYVVDRGQYAVHRYKIADDGLQFEYIRDYIVIANVNYQSNLVSCVIYNKNLFVGDDVNNCLHIFTLTGDCQSSYLCDNTITPFSPGSLCIHGKYLYVTNCSSESAGILVFNEEYQPIDWF